MIYFDNCSTTKVDYLVYRAIRKNSNIYFNSNSNNTFGIKSKNLINRYRKKIACFLKCSYKEIFFTSGSTESNSLIINRLLQKNDNLFFITSKIEHFSILKVIKKNLKFSKNFVLKYLDFDNKGRYDLDQLKQIIVSNSGFNFVVCLSWVNNEIGTVQDIFTLDRLCNKKNIFLHIDSSQAAGRIPINLSKFNINSMIFSPHKIHGPKGIGIIYFNSKKVNIFNFYKNKQSKIKSGTLSQDLIVGAGKSCEISKYNLFFVNSYIKKFNNLIIKSFNKIDCIVINGSIKYKVPHIINFYIKGLDRSIIELYLCDFVYSYSSSCNSYSNKGSHVLKNMGLAKSIYKNSIRISFSKYNKKKDIILFIKKIKQMILKYS